MNQSVGKSARDHIRVVLVEDDRTTRSLFQKLIEKSGNMEFCGAWASGEDALRQIQDLRPDVVVVDLELPGISGEDCIRALAALMPGAAFLVLTVHESPDKVFGALQSGASGYLLKGSTPAAILEGIMAVHRGGSPLSPDIAGLVIRAFQKSEPRKSEIPLPSLAPREREILELLATGHVPKEIASALGISYETVRDYMKHIYRKLHVRSRTEAVLRLLESRSP